MQKSLREHLFFPCMCHLLIIADNVMTKKHFDFWFKKKTTDEVNLLYFTDI